MLQIVAMQYYSIYWIYTVFFFLIVNLILIHIIIVHSLSSGGD